MQCPSCGANVNSAFCGYCGAKMPVERVETQSFHGGTVVVNNYYYDNPPSSGNQGPSPSFNKNMGPGMYANAYAGSAPYAAPSSPKSRLAAVLLCVFLGVFGAHRFYLGHMLIGFVYLFTLGAFGIGWLVDLVLLLLGRSKDGNGLRVTEW